MTTVTIRIALLFVLLTGQTSTCQQKQSPPVVIPIVRASATSIVKKLEFFLGRDAQVRVDDETNTIFLRANPIKVQRAREIIEKLDVAPPHGIYVLDLHGTKARGMATIIRLVFLVRSSFTIEPDIQVTANEQTGRVIFSGTEKQCKIISRIVRSSDSKR